MHQSRTGGGGPKIKKERKAARDVQLRVTGDRILDAQHSGEREAGGRSKEKAGRGKQSEVPWTPRAAKITKSTKHKDGWLAGPHGEQAAAASKKV